MLYSDLNVVLAWDVTSVTYTKTPSVCSSDTKATLLVPPDICCVMSHVAAKNGGQPTDKLMKKYIFYVCWYFRNEFNNFDRDWLFIEALNDILRQDAENDSKMLFGSVNFKYPEDWESKEIYVYKHGLLSSGFYHRFYIPDHGLEDSYSVELKASGEERSTSSDDKLDINNAIPCGILNSSLKKLLKTELKLADHGYTISVLDIDISDNYESVQFDFPEDKTLEVVSIKVGIPSKVIDLAKLAGNGFSLVIPRYLSYVYHRGKDTLNTGSTLCAYKTSLNKLFEDDAKSGFYKLGEIKYNQDWKKVIPYYKDRVDE